MSDDITVHDVKEAVKRKYRKKAKRSWASGTLAVNLVYTVLLAGTGYLGWLFLKEREKLSVAHESLLTRFVPQQMHAPRVSQPVPQTTGGTPTQMQATRTAPQQPSSLKPQA